MKLKNYKELFEKKYDGPDDDDDFADDDLYGRPNYPSTRGSFEDDEDYARLKSKYSMLGGLDDDDDDDDDVDDIQSEDMENLLYLLRTLFKNSGVSAEVESKGLDITVYAVLAKKEKMASILKVFDVAKKLKKDILPQYDSEFEMWETKAGEPMLTFIFSYEGSDGDPNYDGSAPF
jgi:hypothetical protein